MWIRCLLRMKKTDDEIEIISLEDGVKGFSKSLSLHWWFIWIILFSNCQYKTYQTYRMCKKAKQIWRAVYHYFQTYPKWASWRLCGTSGARWCRGGHTGSSPWRSSSRPRDCRGCRGTRTWGWELVTNVTTSCHMSLVRTREAHNCESRLWYYTWA